MKYKFRLEEWACVVFTTPDQVVHMESGPIINVGNDHIEMRCENVKGPDVLRRIMFDTIDERIA